MAQLILNKLLDLSVTTENIIKWLTSDDDIDESEWKDLNQHCTRGEFVAYFLNYIRDQFKRPEPSSTVKNSNSVKKQKNPVKSIPQTISELNESIQSKTDHRDSDLDLSINQSIGTPIKAGNSSLIFETPVKKELQNNAFNTSSPFSPVPQLETSTPDVKKKNTSNRSNREKFNPEIRKPEATYQAPHKRQINMMLESDTVFPNLPNNSSFDLIKPALDYSNMFQPNTSQLSRQKSSPSNNKEAKKTQQKKAKQTKCASNEKSVKSNNTPKSSSKSSANSPPKQKANSASKPKTNSASKPKPNSASKKTNPSPRTTVTLADFFTINTQSSKSGSGIKNNSEIQLENNDDEKIEDKSIEAPNTSQNEKQNKPRRIKPTRLNTADDKESNDNLAFGVITRPATANPQFTQAPPTDKSIDTESFNVERGLLRLQRQKELETTTNGIINVDGQKQVKTPTVIPKKPRKIDPLSSTVVIPSLEFVSDIEMLDILTNLYSSFLDRNLIVNPMSELYFIINLITMQYTVNCEKSKVDNSSMGVSKVTESMKSLKFDASLDGVESIKEESYTNLNNSENICAEELGCSLISDGQSIVCVDDSEHSSSNDLSVTSITDDNVKANDKENKVDCSVKDFGTPHNCIYFSTRVLNFQRDFIKSLDRATLKLLRENNQIATFQPELCKYLDEVYSVKFADCNRAKLPTVISTTDTNVYFQVETDNQKNFTTSNSFNKFRKQRDLFYEILRIWEQSHVKPNWNFEKTLLKQIMSMLKMHEDISNYCHLAKLFKSQMVTSCLQSGQQVEDPMDDESLSFLKDLKDINPEKLTHLRERLTTPLSQNGPVPLPAFPGVQEFYKDFILCTYQTIFYTHLKDCILHEILDLTDVQITGSEVEDTESAVDECNKEHFRIYLSSLRLLAKFLGFLMSLPYRSNTLSEVPEFHETINYQVALRKRAVPELDLQTCLRNGIEQGKLSLVLPWIVEFLAMTDIVTLRLPYYTELLEMLYCIYRVSDHFTASKSNEFMSPQTALLIKLVLGWLFEQPNFPKAAYYDWQSRYRNKQLPAICLEGKSDVRGCLTEADTSHISVKHGLTLDQLDMIDERTLYACCPFLTELKILLISGNSVGNTVTNRHITPVTSQLPNKPIGPANKKNIQFQLEEAFFNGQPLSTRKTVEFVSERIASSCVKHFFKTIVQPARQIFVTSVTERRKQQKEVDATGESLKIAKDCINKCEETIPKMCESRARQSIDALLAEDCLSMVKDHCVQIATRMSMERIRQWINSHITNGSIFLNKLEQNNEGSDNDDNSKTDEEKLNGKCLKITDLVSRVREMMMLMVEKRGQIIEAEAVTSFWDTLYTRIVEHPEPLLSTEQLIFGISVDFAICLIAYRNDLFTTEIQDKAMKLWKMDVFESDRTPLKRMLASRNVMILHESNSKRVWINYGKFIKRLQSEGFLNMEELSNSAVALFRQTWPPQVMLNLSRLLNELLANCKSSGEETERLRLMMDWVAETLQNIGNDYH